MVSVDELEQDLKIKISPESTEAVSMLVQLNLHIKTQISSIDSKLIYKTMVFMYEPYMRKILFNLRYANKIGDVKIELMSSGFGLWRKVYQEDSAEEIEDFGSLQGRFN